MSRWKASAIHAGISILLLATIAIVMALTWYPPLLAWAGGKMGIVGILFGVDACLGPLMTLVVFKAGKPGLKVDLGIIALLQVLGMSYGLYVLYEARPVYIVFAVDRFELVSAVDIPQEALVKASQVRYQSLPVTGPEIVAAKLPQDSTERMRLAFSVVKGGPDVHQLPQYYLPYGNMANEAIAKASPLDQLMGQDGPTRSKLARWLEKNSRNASSVKCLPLMAAFHELTVLVDSGSGEVLDIVNIIIKPASTRTTAEPRNGF